jgi:Ankyrin repeats (3 copies)
MRIRDGRNMTMCSSISMTGSVPDTRPCRGPRAMDLTAFSDEKYPHPRLDQPNPLEHLHWPAEEFLEDRARTGHFGLAREILGALGGYERDLILRDMFWYGLARADWDLARFCVDAGFVFDPKHAHAATLDASAYHGDGAIHDALAYLPGRSDVIEWLLDHGADAERRGRNNYTPLISAARVEGEAATVTALLRHGADIEAGTIIDGDITALMAAAWSGSLATVRVLLEHGADARRLAGPVDRDAAGHARLGRHFEVAEFIEQYLAGRHRRKRRELPPDDHLNGA